MSDTAIFFTMPLLTIQEADALARTALATHSSVDRAAACCFKHARKHISIGGESSNEKVGSFAEIVPG